MHRPLSLAVLLAASAHVQAQGTWVSMPGIFPSPPGTAASITLDSAASNEVFSAFDVRIYGFWREDVLGADGVTYQRLSFPGLDRIGQVGAPDLPAVRIDLAGSRGLQEFKFHGVSQEVKASFFGLRPLPTFVEGVDEDFDPTWDPGPGDPTGTEPKWAYDAAVYQGVSTWPAEVAPAAPQADDVLGPIRGASIAVNPVTWNPSTGVLQVSTQMTFVYQAVGSAGPLVLTKLADEVAAAHFDNWEESKTLYPLNPTNYHARYLIVAQSMWWDTIEPFIHHKRTLGFQTAMIEVEPDVDAIRAAIASWYNLGDPGYDHYVLLVGDTDWIPLANIFQNGVLVQSDDPYGCVGPLDQSKEVHVGRISADHEDSLGWQLDKIMEYELNPAAGNYSRAILVSHKEGAPGKYTGSHTKVRDASYSHPPTFVPLFGETGVDNWDVIDESNAGAGIIAYRGHGTTTMWTDWNTVDGGLHKNGIGPNFVSPMNPIVWAITCTNANLDFEDSTTQDCMSEVWMEASEGGVASYGATRTTSTTPNHRLNEELFRVVFDQGVTTHGKAIDLAEQSVWSEWPGHHNPWAYLLLGDPSMTIRRGLVLNLGLAGAPSEIKLDNQQQGIFNLSASGVPDGLDQGLVSIYKPSFLKGEPDEASGAYWLDGGGSAWVSAYFATPGTLTLTLRDGDGNVVQEEVPVTMGSAWEDLGNAMGGEYGSPKIAGTGGLYGGQPWSLLLAGARPGAPTFLCISTSQLNLPFLGGLLIPDVATGGLILPLSTNEYGDCVYGGQWVDGVPGGATFYFQHWVVDASGPDGVVSSNGLRGTAPF